VLLLQDEVLVVTNFHLSYETDEWKKRVEMSESIAHGDPAAATRPTDQLNVNESLEKRTDDDCLVLPHPQSLALPLDIRM